MRVFPDQFLLESAFKPTGDQPQAIETLVKGLKAGKERLVLEGVTGSGKTFTMANLIQAVGKQTLIISHNKTLAAQLYAELKAFSRRTRSNISSATTTTTSPKRTSPRPIPTSRRTLPSMTRSNVSGWGRPMR